MLTISQQIVILQAILDSKPIQFKTQGVWHDYDLKGDAKQSLDFARYDWRVKPHPAMLHVVRRNDGSVYGSYPDKEYAESLAERLDAQYSWKAPYTVTLFQEVIDGEATE